MTANTYCATTYGFDGKIIDVECDSSRGLPAFLIVGLGNKAIDEARERVRSAIKNSSLSFPTQRITINLAPANLPKTGSQFDIAIALAILVVSDQLNPSQVSNKLFAGELALDGSIRAIRGAVHLAQAAKKHGIKDIFLPAENTKQANLIKGINVHPVTSLRELFLELKGLKAATPQQNATTGQTPAPSAPRPQITIDDIYGQDQAKRALLIAAAGHHNILFDGPPGAGKTMLAKALVSLLPPLKPEEIIEVTKLHNLAGEADDAIITTRPFRSPHHTASYISIVGGGSQAQPGEISLAHNGVLFLDELPEYPRISLEALRQPLEDRMVHISRAAHHVSYPANFMLVATQNPCPCGYLGDRARECVCSIADIARYQKRISGPLLDRIDMVIPVSRVEHSKLIDTNRTNPHLPSQSEKMLAQAISARERQTQRYGDGRKTNASLSNRDIKNHLTISAPAKILLDKAAKQLELSARSYFKTLKVAQTIADLDSADTIMPQHVSESLQYRKRI